MSTLYWLTVLGNVGAFAAAACGIFAVLCVFVFIFSCFDNDWPKSNRKTFKISLIGICVSSVLWALIPSKKELYAIYGVGTVIDYAKGSNEVKKLPDNAVKALNMWLENVNKDKKDSTNNN